AAVRTAEASGSGWTAVTVVALVAAGNRGDDASAGINPAHRVVLSVHDNDVVLEVTAHGLGRAPGGRQRRAAVARITPHRFGSGNGGQDALRVHLPHPVAFSLADVRIAQPIHAHGSRPHNAGLNGPLAISSARLLARARKGADKTRT